MTRLAGCKSPPVASTSTLSLPSESGSTPELLQCTVLVSRMFQLSQKQRAQLSSAAFFSEPRVLKERCVDTAVYRVFVGEEELDMCNLHFNQYFETHEIEADMVTRLSDNEEDFTHNGRNYKGKDKDSAKRKTRRYISLDEPMCRVPRPLPVSKTQSGLQMKKRK